MFENAALNFFWCFEKRGLLIFPDPGNLLLLSVQGPSEPCPVNMTYEGNGIYNVSYKPQEKGEYVISIRWGNQSIYGSPFVVTVG